MKNFKKVLALVLAVATLLSMATIASALTSKDYTDAADITKNGQTEAIDVLSYIGVLNGLPGGKFAPNATITRAESAKIIAMFDNGATDISSLYASANPFTDCKTNWAKSYIAYCAKSGIIAGVGNGKFAPSANVTGIQYLKMVLIVLDFDAKAEGLEGASWAVNTLALAKKVGLLSGLSKLDVSADLLRGQAAQIMLNALQSYKIAYGQEFLHTAKDTFTYLTVAGAVTTNKLLADDWDLHRTTLSDDFMRPGHEWKQGIHVIGTYWNTPVATYTTKTSECTMLVDLGIAKTDKTSVLAQEYLNGAKYMNGAAKDTDETVYDYTLKHDSASKTPACESKTFTTGQGTLTEVYDMGSNADGVEEYRIVEIETYLGLVHDYKKAVTTNAHTTAGTILINLNSKAADSIGVKLNLKYTSDSFANDDAVLVTYSLKQADGADIGIESVVLAKSTTDKLYGFTTNTDPTTTRIGSNTGTPDAAKFELGYDDSKNVANHLKSENFFYDTYGNVIGMQAATVAKTYIVIDQINKVSPGANTTLVKADLVGLDAKLVDDATVTGMISTAEMRVNWTPLAYAHTYATADDFSKFVSSLQYGVEAARNISFQDRLFTYTADANGNYSLTWVNDEADTPDTPDATLYSGIQIKAGNPNIIYAANKTAGGTTAAGTIPTNEYTQFLVHDGTHSYTSYTGYEATKLALTADYAEVVMSGNYASVVYLYGNIHSADTTSTCYVADPTDVNYLTGTDGSTGYYAYTVYIDGTATTVYNKSADAFNGTRGLYKLTYQKDTDAGILTFTATFMNPENNIYKVSSVKDKVLVATQDLTEGYVLPADATVYIVNGKSVTKAAVTDVIAGTYFKAISETSSNGTITLKTIYIVDCANDGTYLHAADNTVDPAITDTETGVLATVHVGTVQH